MLIGIKFSVTVCSYLVYSSTSKIKKVFFLFLPSHPHTCGSSALFIGVSVVRASVRANFLPSHSPHTLAPSFFRQKAYCLLRILRMGVRFNRQGANKAAVYRQCRYAALLVAGMLPLWCRYAATLVFLCWTDSIPMLDQQFSYAGPLVPECFTLLVLLFQFVYRQYQGKFRNEVRLAALRSVSLRLQSLNQKTLTDCSDAHGIFYTDSFFDLYFDSDCTLTGQGGF